MLTLPIDARLDEIVATLRSRRNLVLVAEPGAGKTTRVPRALLEHGLSGDREVIVLEPRRIATRLAAARVAEELGEPLGERVGYQVRYERKGGRNTKLWFLTEGLLSRRLASEPTLPSAGVVVFDEFHERHIHADLGLAMLRQAQLTSRRDLRLVVMSATIDAERVADYLDAAIVRVEGRVFPVETSYEKPDDRFLDKRVGSAVRALVAEKTTGDVLVFLPGAAEIRRAMDACAGIEGYDVLPLHGELAPAEQDRAVKASSRPKIICATNVAETSITIPTVTAVVDSGLARIAKHSPWSGLPALEVGKISQASAIQRAGRAGRVQKGRAVRLYTQHDFDTRPRHDESEIRRMDLSDVALMLLGAGHDPRTFPYFERPHDAALDVALALLERLDASHEGLITKVGREMLALPLHPRLSRLVLAAKDMGIGARGALAAALLGERDVLRVERGARRGTNDVGSSDLVARMERFERADEDGLRAASVEAEGLDRGTAFSVKRALDTIARAANVPRVPDTRLYEDEDAVLRAMLIAFPDRVGKRRETRGKTIVLSGGGSADIADSSIVADAELVIAYDATKTAQGVSVRGASAIEAEWLLELFPDRVIDERTLRFDPKTEQVEAVTTLRYDAVVLDRSVRRDVTGPEVAQVLARAAREAGLERFVSMDALMNLRHRVAFAKANGFAIDALDDTTIDEAFVALADGARSFADLRGGGLIEAIRTRLGRDTLARLERFAPDHVGIAGRQNVPITYEADRPPHMASRLQDFFGTADGPRICDGRVPVVLHLLSPNQRAVQVTTDLAGFWERHYPAVRKELMRKYPRHFWPEDPRTAEPRKPLPRQRR